MNGGSATEPIWRVLASSLGISSWTPLKPQHSNPNPNPLANQLWCIYFLPLRFMQDAPKAVRSIPYVSVAFFPSLKHNFIAYRSSSRPDCIFEIQQLWQSGFSRLYSNRCCSCSFEPEIIKIGQSSHKVYSNNSEFSRVYDNFKCLYKESGNLLNASYIYIYMCVCVCVCVCVYINMIWYQITYKSWYAIKLQLTSSICAKNCLTTAIIVI